MFGFFSSPERKLRRRAGEWLEVAERVWAYRRDLMTPEESVELRLRTAELRQRIGERAGVGDMQRAIDAAEATLRRVGGAIYPKSGLVDNVEFLLVAAIVILGFRAYFVTWFKIPTNSMWPTYHGMTPQVYPRAEEEPGTAATVFRAFAFGAWPRRFDAPADGEVLIPVGGNQGRGLVRYREVTGRKWLVIPAKVREYTLLVGEKPVTLRVPLDFDFDWAVHDGFFAHAGPYSSQAFSEAVRSSAYENRLIDGRWVRLVRTGRHVRAGERLLGFDEMTGDNLFVDRFSYHFVRPAIGSGAVFRTRNIPYIMARDGDQHYVKRLVGLPGDELRIEGTTLMRNGSPITGTPIFAAQARRLDRYPGYLASGSLAGGATVKIPPGGYFMMGDNSPHSGDSRTWDTVPQADLVGRPIWVYFPFTSRWGLAK